MFSFVNSWLLVQITIDIRELQGKESQVILVTSSTLLLIFISVLAYMELRRDRDESHYQQKCIIVLNYQNSLSTDIHTYIQIYTLNISFIIYYYQNLFLYQSRTPNTITIEAQGVEEVYELLCILDFNNVRKRMSVRLYILLLTSINISQ